MRVHPFANHLPGHTAVMWDAIGGRWMIRMRRKWCCVGRKGVMKVLNRDLIDLPDYRLEQNDLDMECLLEKTV